MSDFKGFDTLDEFDDLGGFDNGMDGFDSMDGFDNPLDDFGDADTSSNGSNNGFGGGNNSGFGDFRDSSDGFGSSNSFGNSSGGFSGTPNRLAKNNTQNNMNNNNMSSNNSGNDEDDLLGLNANVDLNSISNSLGGDMQNVDQGKASKKKALIIIVLGILGLCLAFFIASKISSKKSDNNTNNASEYTESAEPGNQVTKNENANEVMSGGSNNSNNSSNKQVVINSSKDSDFTWTDIGDTESIEFTENYVDAMFTITGIKHRARTVDDNKNLVVKTTLLGSISGLSGTYSLDIPYNKGVKLVVGSSFDVKILLGTYNDKFVVGDIQY